MSEVTAIVGYTISRVGIPIFCFGAVFGLLIGLIIGEVKKIKK